jgi:hypothetical protein
MLWAPNQGDRSRLTSPLAASLATRVQRPSTTDAVSPDQATWTRVASDAANEIPFPQSRNPSPISKFPRHESETPQQQILALLRTLSLARSIPQLQLPTGVAEQKKFGLGDVPNPHANKRNMFAIFLKIFNSIAANNLRISASKLARNFRKNLHLAHKIRGDSLFLEIDHADGIGIFSR